jgi:glycosyltransferase involved in cell wall biosynthesis
MKSVGLFLGVEPSAGGMFQYAQSVLEGLRYSQAKGCRVEVAYVNNLWKPILAAYPFSAIQVQKGYLGLRIASLIMVLRLTGSVSRTLARYMNPIPVQLERLGCDLWIFPAQDALSYQVNLPVVTSIHDLMHRYEPDFPEVSQNGRFGIREHRFRNIVAWSRAVLVDSEMGRRHVVESYGTAPEKVHLLPYVPAKYIEEDEPADFENLYHLPSKFLFYPAQFWAHKNHCRLLTAAASVLDRCPDLNFVFCGRMNHEYEKVLSHAVSLGMLNRVTFTGYVPDRYLSGFYRRARALIMPTFFGPTNIPPLEAFYCGCPTALSDNYGMPEQARGASLLFAPQSEEQIANAIERLWNDDELCRVLIERGRNNALLWNQREFGHELDRILNEVMFKNGDSRMSVFYS